MSLANWNGTEKAHSLEQGTLGAVIFYSDRSWSTVTVYGPTAVGNAVSQPKPWNQNPQVTQKKKNQLPTIVTDGTVTEGTNFGVTDGKKVLLVSGYAPEPE